MLVFEGRGKPQYPKKNLSEQSREPTTRTHWCEASAFTTAPTLLPKQLVENSGQTKK